MESILKTSYPVVGVEKIEIFAPHFGEMASLTYPVQIDGNQFLFFLNHQAAWEVSGDSETIIPDELKWYICGLIEKKNM
jgi:hypothetical protein